MQRHQHRIYAFARGLARDHHEAEEVAQETFIRAHRALSGWDEARRRELNESAWLHRVALNVFRNRLRARRATVSLEEAAEPAADGLAPERVAELREAIRRLPPRYREAIVLRHVQGFDYEEMASITERPAGTLKSDVHRGMRLLKEVLR